MILALDLGVKCGWCTDTASGVWNLKPKSYESAGMKLIKFKSSLEELVQTEKPELIVYEKPGGRNYTGVRSIANFEGTLITYCIEHDIEYRGYSAGQIKKFATGKGNANKEKMTLCAIAHFDRTFIDDNEVDAVWLHELAKSEFNL